MSTNLMALPPRWSNKGETESLRPDAAASLSRMIPRAVADTGTNFQLYDAYRSEAEQIALFEKNYRNTGRTYKTRDTDRWYDGTVWRRVTNVSVASPDLIGTGTSANHLKGIAIDIHPGPIQRYIQNQGRAHGWSWAEGKRNGEAWHFVYNPANDRYRSEGYLDHAAVQRVVGAEVDGKIGTGTVAKIKSWQASQGLTADGKVGPKTKAAMGLSGASPGVREPDAVIPPTAERGGFEYTYARDDWDTQGVADKVHPYDMPVKGIYLHWPGSSTKFHGMTAEEIAAALRGYRRDHQDGRGWFDIGYGAAVDWAGRTYQLRGLDMEVGSNGGSVSNSEAGSILLLTGTGERPTAEMIAGVNGLLSQYGDRYGQGYLRGHRESPDASSSCPGDAIMGLIGSGAISWTGEGIVLPGGALVGTGAGSVIVDGRLGKDSIRALQRFLNSRIKARVLKIDGRAGESTWKSLQEYLSAPYKDGQISRQSYRAAELGNGVVNRKTAWEYTGRGSDGSQTVELLQTWVGVEPDGVWYEGTTEGLQAKLNVHRVGM